MLLFIDEDLLEDPAVREFQNISCYCLSSILFYLYASCIYFKTSHVIVYRVSIDFLISVLFHFKTSHVIVYLQKNSEVLGRLKISKHLMLLFIKVSTHPVSLCLAISKHLMLLFIQLRSKQINGQWDFKTSHVIVYLLWRMWL